MKLLSINTNGETTYYTVDTNEGQVVQSEHFDGKGLQITCSLNGEFIPVTDPMALQVTDFLNRLLS